MKYILNIGLLFSKIYFIKSFANFTSDYYYMPLFIYLFLYIS